MSKSPEEFAHLEWLGYVQPVGLVVSIPALLNAQAYVPRNVSAEQQRLLACLPRDANDEVVPEIRDFPAFTRHVLGWEATDLLGAPGSEAVPPTLESVLPGYNETLRPTFAVREFQPKDLSKPWLLLVKSLPVGTPLDALAHDDSHWQATPHAKFERLLRETQVPIGLLVNGTHLRLVYAPRGESSGYATFPVADMLQVAGRPILAGLHLLLSAERLFTLPEKQRLPAILADSRRYQNVVSTQLAEQVLAALYELVRGFQSADEQRRGELLRAVLAADPNHVYAGLLTVLLRLVFILFAEDRGLLSHDPLYSNHYSLTGLFERLRADFGRYPDTMDQRFGAWAQLLTLFRLIHDGGSHGAFRLPPRLGYLFDPHRYHFLEGRAEKTPRGPGEKVDVPRVSDGVIYRVLANLLVLNGERLSYRTLDVQEIGSVYETMMGFNLEVAAGRSIAIKPTKSHGAPPAINLEALLAAKPADRVKWLAEATDQKLTGQAAEALKAAATIDDLLAALERKIARDATPNVVPRGAMVLQPSDERRKSGSHYTPRALTEPIVRETLRPILGRLGGERRGGGRSGVGDGGKPSQAPAAPAAPPHPPSPNSQLPSSPIVLGGGRSGVGDGGKPSQAPAAPPHPPSPNSHLPSSSSGVSHDHHHLVSRSPRLAVGNGSRDGMLRGDETISARGTVRDDEPDSPSSSVDSGEHRGGSRERFAEGVSPVPSYGPSEPTGTGNAPPPQSASRPSPSSDVNATSPHHGPTGADAPGPAKIPLPPAPTPQLPAPTSFPSFPTPDQILNLRVCDPAMGSGAFLVETCRQLADELVEAWHAHDCLPQLPPDEDEVLHARRLIAQRCLYGVDKNRLAVDLSKLSLWLATLAKDHPFTFLDHSLRCGDSLVGLTRRQISGFHWEPKRQKDIEGAIIETRIQRAAEARLRIMAAGDDTPYSDHVQQMELANESLSLVRLIGDAVVSAFFAADKPKAREQRLDELFGRVSEWFAANLRIDLRQPLADAVASLHAGEHPIQPFHWEIEFPEVFATDGKRKPTGGFDAIVGNPPFMGGMLISTSAGDAYKDFLYASYVESGNRMDLVAYFFRRAYENLRMGGSFGLIATNTIAQGDTRTGGLRFICVNGGTIYSATRRLRWPGAAAVVVSVVHVVKGTFSRPFKLDGKPASRITAYLFHKGDHDNPASLAANRGKCFVGTNVLGMGFTFDDTDRDGVASPLSEMHRVIEKDRRNAERIFPFIGGEEVNGSPTQSHHRFIINFGEMTEEEAREWPDLMQIVETRVKPDRSGKNGGYSAQWWLFGRRNQQGQQAINGLDRVLVCPLVSNKLSFVFLSAKMVHSHKLALFPFTRCAAFCVLQSQAHEVWVRMFSSTMKDDLNYSPSDCFETFPFPAGVLEHASSNSQLPIPDSLLPLETAGREYYEFRAALMIRNNEGLTKTYNRFHDPGERSEDILRLRELHAAMDRAVLSAYGWQDLAQTATCEFLLDYEEEELGDGEWELGNPSSHSPSPSSRRRRKPWRYRWPDDFRDEVLARLLALNATRAEQERLTGLAAAAEKPKRKAAPRKKKSPGSESPGLPGM